MQSHFYGFESSEELVWQGWGGIVADIWQVRCEPHAHGDYVSPDARLFVVLDITPGGQLELTSADGQAAIHSAAWSMSYIPAHMRLRSRAIGIQSLSHLDIHLPEAALMRRFGRSLDRARLDTARLQFHDDRIATIAGLIVDECHKAGRLDDHFGAGLTDALLTALFDVRADRPKSRPSLSRQQLDRSLDYIDEHCFDPIRLADVAGLVGLSETHFSHAFKASTGVPPLRWQMESRITKVKNMLADERQSLSEIAATAGFSDQAHFARSFKRLVGITPSQWRRSWS